MPVRSSWQDLLKSRSQHSNFEPLITEKVHSQGTSGKQQSDTCTTLTLQMLLKSANPSWTSHEFKAAKKKLKTIAIVSYSDLEEALLEGNLNEALRAQGLKTFATSTLERLKITVLAEQDKLRRAAEEAEVQRAEQEKLRQEVERAEAWSQPRFNFSAFQANRQSDEEPRPVIQSIPSIPLFRARDAQNTPSAKQSEAPSTTTLYMLLKTSNPGWNTKDLEAAMKKLKTIGIVTYFGLEEVLLQGRGILNKRLRDNGLKIFAPTTLQRLKSAVKLESPREHQVTPRESQRLCPVFESRYETPCQSFDLGSTSESDVEDLRLETPSWRETPCQSFNLGSPSGSDVDDLDTPSWKDSDTESWYGDSKNDDCMRWYDDSDCESHWRMIEQKLSDLRTTPCKVKIAPLDLSKAVRMNGGHESQYSSRTESTAVGISPPVTPAANRPITFFAIGTP